jgi:N utilization substance protein B
MAAGGRVDPRRRAREAALKILYEWEVGGEVLDTVLTSWRDLRPNLPDDGAEVVWPRLEPEVWEMTEALSRGTAGRLADIDGLIGARAEHWRLERMPVVDRLILRIAVFEMLASPGTPRPVVINEALELARTYSTEEAVKFINGVLDGIQRELVEAGRAR